jgi:hypothetical protein
MREMLSSCHTLGTATGVQLEHKTRLALLPAPFQQALIASLRESGMEPTVTLQHKSCSDSIPKAVAQCAWTCAMCFGSCTMHAVAESASQIQPGDSLLGPVLTAAQVASLQGALLSPPPTRPV